MHRLHPRTAVAFRLLSSIAEDSSPQSLLARSTLVPSAFALAWSGPAEPAQVAHLQRRLQPLLDRLLEESADLVIVDGPSLAEGGDLLTYNMDVDDVILVVRPGHTSRADLERTRELLEHARGQPTGAILIGGTR